MAKQTAKRRPASTRKRAAAKLVGRTPRARLRGESQAENKGVRAVDRTRTAAKAPASKPGTKRKLIPSARRPHAISLGSAPGVPAAAATASNIAAAGPSIRPERPVAFEGFDPPLAVTPRPPRRTGTAVVRPDDLLALRIELINLVPAGSPPKLQRAQAGEACIVLHFPPQNIGEEAVFETAADAEGYAFPQPPPGQPPQFNDPDASNPGQVTPLPARPLRARIAGESRLVFRVPEDAQIDYRLDAILAACRDFELKVVASATPPATTLRIEFADIWVSAKDIVSSAQLDRAQAAQVTLAALRASVLQRRTAALPLQLALSSELVQTPQAPNRRKVAQRRAATRLSADRIWVDTFSSNLVSATQVSASATVVLGQPPRLAAPRANETSLELPFRLMISPNRYARWVHATQPLTSAVSGRTELWHTRMGTLIERTVPTPDGPQTQQVVEEAPVINKTVRAIWLRFDPRSGGPFNPDYTDITQHPEHDLSSPWRMPLDEFDRFELVHLSGNHRYEDPVTSKKHSPRPVNVNALMLTSLGAWFDARGTWQPPASLSVQEWVHGATQARDHYVKVVYKGVLFPFGHRASLVKVTERKFHFAEPGTPAILRQRMYIIVREPLRTFAHDADAEKWNDGAAPDPLRYHRQFPFVSVQLLTTVTPNLDPPESADITQGGQSLFRPFVLGKPLPFDIVAVDLEGRRVQFALPLVFIDNVKLNTPGGVEQAATFYTTNTPVFTERRTAQLNGQKLAYAPPRSPGDTACDTHALVFNAFTKNLGAYPDSKDPIKFYPFIEATGACIPAAQHLTGSSAPSFMRYYKPYLTRATPFGGGSNDNEVFLEVTGGDSKLDFSKQGDKSGGFVQPNLTPKALSRTLGPISSSTPANLDEMAAGKFNPKEFFSTLSPKLFGVINLWDIVVEVAGLDSSDGLKKFPKFISEAATQIENFVGDLQKLLGDVDGLKALIGEMIAQALQRAVAALRDVVAQEIKNLTANAQNNLTAVNQALANLNTKLDQVIAAAGTLLDNPAALAQQVSDLQALISAVRQTVSDANAPGLPVFNRQSITSKLDALQSALGTFAQLPPLAGAAQPLALRLADLILDPGNFSKLLSDSAFANVQLPLLKTDIDNFAVALKPAQLLEGALKDNLLHLCEALSALLAALPQFLDALFGEEIKVRLEWVPEIKPWPKADPLFVPHDKRAFVLAAEARVKKTGGAPKGQVSCALSNFSLVLIGQENGFIEIDFERIGFSVDAGAKMNVDVLLRDIRFIGVLSFVETLRDLIPLDGFSDPPSLDISERGIDANFSMALPGIAVGMFSLQNLSLGAGFTVPFIGEPLSVRFFFCERHKPFLLTVTLFGGGGFFGITLDPGGVQVLEAAFEFGASISVDLGVASGGVHVMAGVYFRMEQDEASLTGYFRLGGYVDVLGLISASIELYLELRYEFASGKCVGRAQLTIEIEIFMFSMSVTVSAERKFAGSNGDPTFVALVGPSVGQSVAESPWATYCEAFA